MFLASSPTSPMTLYKPKGSWSHSRSTSLARASWTARRSPRGAHRARRAPPEERGRFRPARPAAHPCPGRRVPAVAVGPQHRSTTLDGESRPSRACAWCPTRCSTSSRTSPGPGRRTRRWTKRSTTRPGSSSRRPPRWPRPGRRGDGRGYRGQNRIESIASTGSIVLKQKLETWTRKAS
jgi:hypothetical protein